ncbi:MAG: TetR/AcrR family transcriptional regulator [Gemmatimonadota bacterium]|jgi:AcrR family transcriptional regulator|nr:TetR/AcrR family transcriptional regulator [Gemmatimonadota bacterium]
MAGEKGRDKGNGTRARILNAALEVVRECGLEDLSTRAIARRTGLTQPAIYRHFTGVEEIVRETLACIRDLFAERLATSDRKGDPRENLLAALDCFRDFAIREPRLYDALFLRTGNGVPVPVTSDTRTPNIFAHIVERVTACARDGVIRPAGPVGSALSLIAHSQGLILMFRQGRFGSGERFSETYSRSMQDLLRGLS